MIKEIVVAGIKLNNYTVLENLFQINGMLDKNRFTIIEEIYMKTILAAKEDEVVKEVLESLDISVISETDILEAVGENTVLRKREIEKREFFHHFMKILERSGTPVYILGQTAKKVQEAGSYLTEEFPRLQIVGANALEECAGVEEGMINDINMLAPEVILSILPTPVQEHFLMENKSMISANVWYGVGDGNINGKSHGIMAMLKKHFRKNKLMNYENDVEE